MKIYFHKLYLLHSLDIARSRAVSTNGNPERRYSRAQRGYIARRSGHPRASTVDLTLVDLESGKELDMGSGYDLFDTLSWPADPRPDAQQRANRLLLRQAMLGAGFRPLKQEWWHFTLADEPYPDSYFDLPVR